MVKGAAEGVRLEYAAGLGRVAQSMVIIISISVAIGQLEIKAELLNYVVAIVLLSVGLAGALALGLASKGVASQIIAGIYVRELYEIGQQIKVDGVEGRIEEMGTVKTILVNDSDEWFYIANRVLLEQQVTSR
jgi:small-conductance mechanosensitive channel